MTFILAISNIRKFPKKEVVARMDQVMATRIEKTNDYDEDDDNYHYLGFMIFPCLLLSCQALLLVFFSLISVSYKLFRSQAYAHAFMIFSYEGRRELTSCLPASLI